MAWLWAFLLDFKTSASKFWERHAFTIFLVTVNYSFAWNVLPTIWTMLQVATAGTSPFAWLLMLGGTSKILAAVYPLLSVPVDPVVGDERLPRWYKRKHDQHINPWKRCVLKPRPASTCDVGYTYKPLAFKGERSIVVVVVVEYNLSTSYLVAPAVAVRWDRCCMLQDKVEFRL